jgi:calcineurin-like phosphoesterase family protein
MEMKEQLQLSEGEAQLLRVLCYARMVVLKAGETKGAEDLPLHNTLDEHTARMALPVFDFYRSAASGNKEAVQRQAAAQQTMGPNAGGGYYDGMIEDYLHILSGLGIGEDGVLQLRIRIKAYIQSQKVAPARIMYIADCHFYHNRICREMDNRGFPSYAEMNEHMIARWNEKVTARDSVYILGDFSIAKGDATEKVIRRLQGKLHLIIGNHDRYLQDKGFDRSLFRSIEPYQEIRDNGRLVVLSHYPVFCYKGQYRPNTYMLYGHVHNTHDEALINRFIQETRETTAWSRYAEAPAPIPCNMINCFCMFSDYKPLTLSEWIDVDRKRRAEQPDRRIDNGTSRADTE